MIYSSSYLLKLSKPKNIFYIPGTELFLSSDIYYLYFIGASCLLIYLFFIALINNQHSYIRNRLGIFFSNEKSSKVLYRYNIFLYRLSIYIYISLYHYFIILYRGIQSTRENGCLHAK